MRRKQRAIVLTEPPIAAEARCRDCGAPIYLPEDRVSFATVCGDDRCCPWSRYGWHEPEQVIK
jgi:hypothetical protein